MEEKYEIIKAKKENAFQRIKDAENVLKEIREECDHPKEFIEFVNYMWAPGHISPNTKICGICGDIIPLYSSRKNEWIITPDET